jgi:hypothetical protein
MHTVLYYIHVVYSSYQREQYILNFPPYFQGPQFIPGLILPQSQLLDHRPEWNLRSQP